MLYLRGAFVSGPRIGRAALGVVGGFRDQQQLAVIKREPGLPLRIGNRGAAVQRLAQRRQFFRDIRIFGEQRGLLARVRGSASHVADKMHDSVAMGDIDIELIERVAAEVLEILLHLHMDIVPFEIGAQQIAIGAKFIRNRGD